jgi:hypothetical protein
MEATKNQDESQEKTSKIQDRIDVFFERHHIGTLLHNSGIRKVRGTSPLIIIKRIFGLSFYRVNIYRGIVQNTELEFLKDAAYDLLNGSRYNWRTFLLWLSSKVAGYITSLTDDSREKVLIIDESPYDRSRSKEVELLAKVYDHCTKRYLKGFRLLTMGWSDGASMLPLDFALLSSAEERNRHQGITKAVDKRSCGYKRRQEAMTKATYLLESMVKRVVRFGVRAQYILMDSWFGFPKTITTLSTYIPVICMVKNMYRVFYQYNGKKLTLDALYRQVKKRPGKAKVKASVIVTMNTGQKVKIVFVRDRRGKGWLAILSTDITLLDEEVIRIYGKRWDIEVFFKMEKQYLDLVKGVQIRDFDGLIAYTTIAMMRYTFLSYEQRLHDDPRTFGELFYAYCDEIKDLSVLEALQRILTLAIHKLRNNMELSEQIVQEMLEAFMGAALKLFDLKPPMSPITI